MPTRRRRPSSGSMRFAAQVEDALDRGLHPRAAGMALHRHLAQQIVVPRPSVIDAEVRSIRIGAGESVRAFDDVLGPVKPCARQQGRRDAVLGRAGRMDALDGRARLVELRQPARERGHQPDARRDLWSAESSPLKAKAGGRDRGAEASAGGRALEAAPEMGRLDREADADHRLVAGRDRGDEVRRRHRPRRPAPARPRTRSRPDAAWSRHGCRRHRCCRRRWR